jgi:proteic killer suppression protein
MVEERPAKADWKPSTKSVWVSCAPQRRFFMAPRFRDRRTERFARGERVAAFQAFERTADLRLQFLLNATSLTDLRQMPGWRLEHLKGNRAGQWSIRINDQWRICFEWSDEQSQPFNIEIVDYH